MSLLFFFRWAFVAAYAFAATTTFLGADVFAASVFFAATYVFAATDLVAYLDLGRGYFFLETDFFKQFFFMILTLALQVENPSKCERFLNRTWSIAKVKSEINLTVPFILDIIKAGAAHWELLIFFHTPILINLSSSFLRVGLWIIGIGKGFA